jgi:hypothetical protein
LRWSNNASVESRCSPAMHPCLKSARQLCLHCAMRLSFRHICLRPQS